MALMVECPACKGTKCDQCNQQGWIVKHDLVLRDVRMTVDPGDVTDSGQRVITPPCPACEAAARELATMQSAYAQVSAGAEAMQRELAALRARLEAVENIAFAVGAMDYYPCFVCGYNGENYYQPSAHPCAARHHKYRDCINLAQAELRALLRKKAK